MGFEHLQGWRCTTSLGNLLHCTTPTCLPVRKCLLPLRWNSICFNLCPRHPALPVGATGESLAASSFPAVRMGTIPAPTASPHAPDTQTLYSCVTKRVLQGRPVWRPSSQKRPLPKGCGAWGSRATVVSKTRFAAQFTICPIVAHRDEMLFVTELCRSGSGIKPAHQEEK